MIEIELVIILWDNFFETGVVPEIIEGFKAFKNEQGIIIHTTYHLNLLYVNSVYYRMVWWRLTVDEEHIVLKEIQHIDGVFVVNLMCIGGQKGKSILQVLELMLLP